MSSRELELKLSLADRDSHRRFCNALPGFEGELIQRNIYFDQRQLLSSRDMLLRLRIEQTSAYLTLKLKNSMEQGVFDSQEYEIPIDQEIAISIEQSAPAHLSIASTVIDEARSRSGQALDRLIEWGRIRNLRRCYRVSPGCLIEVDETEFPGSQLRWEVEVEGDQPQQARKYLEKIARDAGVVLESQLVSKAQQLARIQAS